MPDIDPNNPNVIADYAPRATAKPPSPQPLTKLSDAELDQFAAYLSTHTACGRLALAELIAAFKRAESEAGFIIVKAQANG
jgi:hypothetical protein